MAYDNKYKTGTSWLNGDEDDPCSGKILKALYAAIYDENAETRVVRFLMQAYDEQVEAEDNDASEPKAFMGVAAEAFMSKAYVKESLPALKRFGITDTTEAAEARFTWPDALPFDYPIRKGILASVAKRMAHADAELYRELRRFNESNRTKEVDPDLKETK